MFLKIMRRTFWSWWDNISYSILISITGAFNPFFILMIASIWAFYTEVHFFADNASLFFVIMLTCVFAMPFFPSALAGFRLQPKIIAQETENLFLDYWKAFKHVFWRGLLHSIVYGVVGMVLALSILYYKDFLSDIFPYNYILIGISSWFVLLLFMMQSVIVPLIAEDKNKFIEYYRIAFAYTLRNALPLLFISFMHVLLFIILTVPLVHPFLTVIPLVAYFGFVSTLYHWTFMYVDGQVELQSAIPRRRLKELVTPFKFRTGNKTVDEGDTEEDEAETEDEQTKN